MQLARVIPSHGAASIVQLRVEPSVLGNDGACRIIQTFKAARLQNLAVFCSPIGSYVDMKRGGTFLASLERFRRVEGSYTLACRGARKNRQNEQSESLKLHA